MLQWLISFPKFAEFTESFALCRKKIQCLFARNFFTLCPLLPLLTFSIVPMVIVWVMERMGNGLIYSVILMTIVVLTDKG